MIKYLQSKEDNKALLQDEMEAKKMGIKGVPCFIINRQLVLFGAQDIDKLTGIFSKLSR